jgi:hypothetical protein
MFRTAPRSAAAFRGPFILAALAMSLLIPSALEAQGRRAEQLLSDKPPPRRGCNVLQVPRLPALGTLVDSAGLAAGVIRYAEEFPVREGAVFAVYSVVFARDGSVERVSAIDYWLPEVAVGTLENLVRTSLLRQPTGGFSVRLRVDPGPAPLIRVGYSERCLPVPTTRFRLIAPVAFPVERPTPLRLRILVSADGRITGSQLLSSSGSPELDRWVETQLAARTFEPGLIDGVPVAMDYEETITIQSRR